VPSFSGLAVATLLAVSSAPGALLAEGECEVVESEITWGFKESFRSYISGAIALGQWTTSGDVSYETPAFSFSGGEGTIASDRSSGGVAFEGELLFEGHGGILRTSLANPSLMLDGHRRATLIFDVTGDTMDMVSVNAEDVEFVTLEWSAGDESLDVASGEWAVTDAVATLTASGSESFGTYPAGELFDPLDMRLLVTPSCFTQSALNPWFVAGGVLGLALAGGAIVWITALARKSREQGRQ
jgi:Htaa